MVRFKSFLYVLRCSSGPVVLEVACNDPRSLVPVLLSFFEILVRTYLTHAQFPLNTFKIRTMVPSGWVWDVVLCLLAVYRLATPQASLLKRSNTHALGPLYSGQVALDYDDVPLRVFDIPGRWHMLYSRADKCCVATTTSNWAPRIVQVVLCAFLFNV